jgi:hypothetical protein
MTPLEDRLRDAARQTGEEVTPDSIAAFDPATMPSPRRARARRGARSWRVAGPLLTAAAIALVAVVTVTLSGNGPSHQPMPSPPATELSGVPAYYVALTATGAPADSPADLTVRSTFTGQVLKTVKAPSPFGNFSLVEGTASDQTFLVGLQVWDPVKARRSGVADDSAQPVKLYLLHFDPSTGRATLDALPIPQLSAQELGTASISPDATRIAVDNAAGTSISVYTLPSGAERTLSLTSAQRASGGSIGWNPYDPVMIAWADDDRTISFPWIGGQSGFGVHILDTSIAGAGTLLTDSRYALPMNGPQASTSSGRFTCDSSAPFLSANGAYILCGGYVVPQGSVSPLKTGTVTEGFAVFSAATGKLITILDSQRAPLYGPAGGGYTVPYLMWSNSDGTVLIGTVGGKTVVIDNGQVRTIPWSSDIAVDVGAGFPPLASW